MRMSRCGEGRDGTGSRLGGGGGVVVRPGGIGFVVGCSTDFTSFNALDCHGLATGLPHYHGRPTAPASLCALIDSIATEQPVVPQLTQSAIVTAIPIVVAVAARVSPYRTAIVPSAVHTLASNLHLRSRRWHWGRGRCRGLRRRRCADINGGRVASPNPAISAMLLRCPVLLARYPQRIAQAAVGKPAIADAHPAHPHLRIAGSGLHAADRRTNARPAPDAQHNGDGNGQRRYPPSIRFLIVNILSSFSPSSGQ